LTCFFQEHEIFRRYSVFAYHEVRELDQYVFSDK